VRIESGHVIGRSNTERDDHAYYDRQNRSPCRRFVRRWPCQALALAAAGAQVLVHYREACDFLYGLIVIAANVVVATFLVDVALSSKKRTPAEGLRF
jgi:hypothetical protein